MIAFPGMLVAAAEQAGMKTPDNPDDFDREDYKHFQVFCNAQLCRPMSPGEHWDNAKVIAEIPEEEITTVTLADLIDRGVRIQF